MERPAGIEPASLAWQANIIPLYYGRMGTPTLRLAVPPTYLYLLFALSDAVLPGLATLRISVQFSCVRGSLHPSCLSADAHLAFWSAVQ